MLALSWHCLKCAVGGSSWVTKMGSGPFPATLNNSRHLLVHLLPCLQMNLMNTNKKHSVKDM